MVTWVQRLKPIVKIFLVIAGCLILQQADLFAQVQFFTSPPVIDSFPVVKTKVSIAYNGRPAPITKSNLSVQEDGQNITNFELLDCDESDAASIAMLFDVSESMMVTLFKGSDEFYRSFVDFTLELTASSELALVPFNDSVRRIIPASYRSQDFFKMNVPADVDEFLDSVGGLQFNGKTDVDLAVRRAAAHLSKGVNRRKAIVLVTDDGIYDRDGLIALLNAQEISLFVLELDNDTIQGNIVTADRTGGKFFSPKDSTELGQTMSLIARALYAKKCTLRYVSPHPCPWWSQKTLWIGLNYQKQNLAETHYFWLGPNKNDSIAPRLITTQVNGQTAIVRATEDFPCERGLRSFTDSALVNFAKISRIRSMPLFAYDSLAVVDLSQPAAGYYIAADSNGNTSRVRISYTPPPDTLTPVWGVPFKTSAEQYQLVATEFRTWDKGLKSIVLDIGSANVVIDSIHFVSYRMAQVYVSRLDKTLPASACLTAIDSVGNDSSICVIFSNVTSDVNPPVLFQQPNQSPYLTIGADVTELRAGDRGIESISVTPLTNVTVGPITFASAFTAQVSSLIIDSLYDARALITAIDSAGNSSQLTVTYTPQADVLSPTYSVAADDLTSRTLKIFEEQPWDRGLRSNSVTMSANVTLSQLSDSRRKSEWKVVAQDPYTVASASFEAIDSAGNSVIIEVVIPAQAPPQELPLTYADALDFGTTQAPALLRRTIDVLNPNDGPIAIARGYWSGDDSVFSLAGSLPTSFAPRATQSINFNFSPKLLGDWTAVYTIETDKGVKYPVHLKGSSTGLVQIIASSETVALSGESGELTFAIGGTPDIQNLDTLSFSIEVDDDLITLGTPGTDCSDAEWICNYALTWSKPSRGRYEVDLVRKSQAVSLEFSNAPEIRVPFTSFMSGSRHSDVKLLDAFASRAIATTTNGSVDIGAACGDSAIRASLSQELTGIREQRTLADGSLSINFVSATEEVIRFRIVDMLGQEHHETSLHVVPGQNKLRVPTADMATGAYRVVISSKNGIYSRTVNIVR